MLAPKKTMRKIVIWLKSTKDWFVNGFAFKKTMIASAVLLLSFLLIFPAGAMSSQTVSEVCANYYVDIAKNHTNDIGDKKLSGLIVEPRDGMNTKMRQDTDKAITDLWGVFKGENASFAPVINANHENNILFSDEHFSSENISLVYSNIGQSSEPYHINRDTGVPIDYKFQSSPIALMFSSSNSGMQDKLHIYISQSQAERKLVSESKEITKDNLQSLQGTSTQLLINGSVCECIIDNIYLDNLTHHFEQPRNPKNNKKYDYYYASDIGAIIGDFVFVILYANKQNVFPETLKRQSLYVMSEYSFRNKTYLEYAKGCYPNDGYSFDYARTNLKNNFVPDNEILQKALTFTPSDIGSVIFIILFFLTFALGIFVIYRYRIYKQPASVTLIAVSCLLPYLIFRIIFVITKNTLVFSSLSLIFNLVLFALFALSIFVLNCFGRKIETENKDV